MSLSVVVVCPNMRRVTVKVTPNSSILQILEEACNRQKLSPEHFDIYHYNKKLDLSLPFRFAGIPNNGQLELRAAAVARTESVITVCLQLESGERFTNDFQSSDTVWDIIQHSVKDASSHFKTVEDLACIYMRQKIIGESIKTTTLRNLGLTQGQAVIRLLRRRPEDFTEQANVSSRLVATAPVRVDSQAKTANLSPVSPEPQDIVQPMDCTDITPADTVTIVPQNNKGVSKSGLQEITGGSARRESRESNKVDSHVIGSGSVGSAEDTSDKSQDEKDIVANEELEIEEEIGEIKYIGDRYAVIYSLDEITSKKKADLPEEFFEVTLEDVKYMMDDYKRQREEFENHQLMTREQRENQILQKLAKYSHTVIRVIFPERWVIQAVFKATETVQDIKEFVTEYLQDKSVDFYLYVTPPKEKLNPSKNLLESNLISAAVIYFGCDIQRQNYLNLELESSFSDPRAAALAAFNSRSQNSSSDISYRLFEKEEQIEKTQEKKIRDPKPSSSSSNAETPSLRQSGDKAPKWLKLAKK